METVRNKEWGEPSVGVGLRGSELESGERHPTALHWHWGSGGSARGTHRSFRQVWTVVSKQTGTPSGKQAFGDTSQGSEHCRPLGLPAGVEGKLSQRPRVHRGEGPSLDFTCGQACHPTFQDTCERNGPERTDNLY